MILYAKQIVVRKAGADLTESEGCFVTQSTGSVSLAAASTTPANVFGLLHSAAAQGEEVSVLLPGFSGIPMARLHSSPGTVTPGTTLALAANGTVKAATTGTIVAVALEAGSANGLVAVRLVEPYTGS